MKIPVDRIAPNPAQQRQQITAEEVASLAESLRTDGLLNAISVEPADINGIHYLIDGERRWRAAILAGWMEIEANIREMGAAETNIDRLALALIGNLQRADMHPVDEAMAFQKLAGAGLTQNEIAARIGKSQSFVSSRLKILEFSPTVQDLFNSGDLPFDNRVMLALKSLNEEAREAVAARCAARGYSASQAISLCKRIARGANIPQLLTEGAGSPAAETRPMTRIRKNPSPARSALPDSDCLPLLLHPLTAKDEYLADAIKQTCLECGMYESGGVRAICPPCPLVLYARHLTRGAA